MKLKSENINSIPIHLNDLNWEYIKSEMPSSTIVCWLFDNLLWGQIDDNGQVSFSDGSTAYPAKVNVMELRVFNASKEIYLRKNGGSFIGRMRVDSDQGDIVVVDTDNYLWGTKGEIKNGYTHITEDNGMHLNIPGSNAGVSKDKRVNLVIRNYIDYNERLMAGYVDARFVEIKM